MSQKDMVLDYIREFGSITPIDAFRDLGITRLSAISFQTEGRGTRHRQGNRNGQEPLRQSDAVRKI